MKNKKVYVVVGLYSGADTYYILSKYGVKSTFEKAQEELKLIKSEIIEDLEKNNINMNEIIIKEENNRLTIIFDSGYYELYQIEERIIDIE